MHYYPLHNWLSLSACKRGLCDIVCQESGTWVHHPITSVILVSNYPRLVSNRNGAMHLNWGVFGGRLFYGTNRCVGQNGHITQPCDARISKLLYQHLTHSFFRLAIICTYTCIWNDGKGKWNTTVWHTLHYRYLGCFHIQQTHKRQPAHLKARNGCQS